MVSMEGWLALVGCKATGLGVLKLSRKSQLSFLVKRDGPTNGNAKGSDQPWRGSQCDVNWASSVARCAWRRRRRIGELEGVSLMQLMTGWQDPVIWQLGRLTKSRPG